MKEKVKEKMKEKMRDEMREKWLNTPLEVTLYREFRFTNIFAVFLQNNIVQKWSFFDFEFCNALLLLIHPHDVHNWYVGQR